MKKIIFSLVLFMVVCCSGVSFGQWIGDNTSSPIVHDGGNMSYLPSMNGEYPANHFSEVFSTVSQIGDIYTNYPLSYQMCALYLIQTESSYISYEDEDLRKLIPYLSYNPNNYDFYNSWRGMYELSFEWGSWSENYGNVYYYKDDISTDVNIVEAYELGVIGRYGSTGIVRSYAWLDDASLLQSKFGYEKAPIESFYSMNEIINNRDYCIQEYEKFNPNINYIWAMFAHNNLKSSIDSINADSEAKGQGTRIIVIHYVPTKPVFTFIN
jgi:hypothetical protein